MRTLGLIAGAALLLAACGGAPGNEPLTISGVNVEADLPSVGSPQAVAYWKNLSPDLETAIAAQFAGSIDPTGKTINVDVDELSLASPFAAGATAQTAQLAGTVTLVNPDGTNAAVYNVTATSADLVTYLPAGENIVTVAPTSAEYYRAIVQAFARGTADTLRAAT
ncbi:MAG TPA: hypothetical protein VFG74_16025 [Miltoncostaeaceae bacterium]|nr:hypothetical protein [Miltoncostaeaceae bacterium]